MLDQQRECDRAGADRGQDDVLLDGGIGAVVQVEAGRAEQEHRHKEDKAGHQECERNKDGAGDEPGDADGEVARGPASDREAVGDDPAQE